MGAIKPGGTGGGGTSLPATPADALLDAGSPSTVLGLNASGVGEALSASATRSRIDAQQDVFTTRGDMARGGAAGVAERFAAVTNGHVVGGDGTDVVSRAIATTLAVDASGNRTALGLGGAATLAVGTTAGTVAAGDDSRFLAVGEGSGTVAAGNDSRIVVFVPPRLATGFTDSQRFARGSVSADAVGGSGKVWLIVGYLSSSTAATRKVWCFQTTTTAGWAIQINGTTVQMIGVGININGAGANTLASLGVTVTAAAAFAIAIEMTATHIRASVNGGAVVATPYTGTLTAPTSGSTMGIGADHSATGNLGFVEGKLGECMMLNSAVGDSALVAFTAAAATSYTISGQLSGAQRALLLFQWLGCDGGAILRTGNGTMNPNGNYTWSQPV